MAEYIEREAAARMAVEAATEIFDCHTTLPLLKVANKIRTIPAADVVEVKHGEWINEEDYLYKCSLCGDKAFLRLGGKPCKYCPDCNKQIKATEHHCKCGQALDWSDTE